MFCSSVKPGDFSPLSVSKHGIRFSQTGLLLNERAIAGWEQSKQAPYGSIIIWP